MRLKEGKLVSEWKDEYGNRALIEEVEIKPHKEAKLEKAYRHFLAMRNMMKIFAITFQFLIL